MKYGFNNIARVELTHALQNSDIQMIYLTAPVQVTIVSNYCNATLESDPDEVSPYPMRFQCYFQTTRQLKLLKQAGFPDW